MILKAGVAELPYLFAFILVSSLKKGQMTSSLVKLPDAKKVGSRPDNYVVGVFVTAT